MKDTRKCGCAPRASLTATASRAEGRAALAALPATSGAASAPVFPAAQEAWTPPDPDITDRFMPSSPYARAWYHMRELGEHERAAALHDLYARRRWPEGYYLHHVQTQLRAEFPHLVSIGWFYGFKLHLVINDRREALAVRFTPGNGDDRRPVPRPARRLFGKFVGDRGHISQKLVEQLFTTHGLRLITNVRKNMRERLLAYADKLLLRKRALIESVNDQLKTVCEIEHSRHRSTSKLRAHLLAGLVAY